MHIRYISVYIQAHTTLTVLPFPLVLEKPALSNQNCYLTCVLSVLPILTSYLFHLLKIMFTMPDDGKLDTESDSGEFWVLMGGFAPIGKKVTTEDDVVPEATPPILYRYSHIPLLSLSKVLIL